MGSLFGLTPEKLDREIERINGLKATLLAKARDVLAGFEQAAIEAAARAAAMRKAIEKHG